jgi:mannose-6-phosphate isomerase-like protein (cupin superfamily)
MNMNTSIQNLRKARPLRDERYGTLFELAGPATGLPGLGFAWAEVDVGAISPAHYHKITSELYHVSEGSGVMILDGHEHAIAPGDCISIAPGVVHSIRNTGTVPLRFFCATSPAYADDDIEI